MALTNLGMKECWHEGVLAQERVDTQGSVSKYFFIFRPPRTPPRRLTRAEVPTMPTRFLAADSLVGFRLFRLSVSDRRQHLHNNIPPQTELFEMVFVQCREKKCDHLVRINFCISNGLY